MLEKTVSKSTRYLSRHFLRDHLLRWMVYGTVAVVSLVFLWILFDLVRGGVTHLSWRFLVEPPRDAGRAGGIGPILVSTLLIVLVALTSALPLGWSTAILLSEFVPVASRPGQVIRFSLQVLASIPSIVFGLFGNAFFSIYLGMGFSILAGGLTLACMLLPILVSTAESRAAECTGALPPVGCCPGPVPYSCPVPSIATGCGAGIDCRIVARNRPCRSRNRCTAVYQRLC